MYYGVYGNISYLLRMWSDCVLSLRSCDQHKPSEIIFIVLALATYKITAFANGLN